MPLTPEDRKVDALERIASNTSRIVDFLETISGSLESLIHTAEDGGAYISVEMLESEDEGDEE